jgi:hypothetical protein
MAIGVAISIGSSPRGWSCAQAHSVRGSASKSIHAGNRSRTIETAA